MRSIVSVLTPLLLLSCSSMDKGVAIHNTEPMVSFSAPIEGETFEMETPITFVAVVDDRETEPDAMALEWISDLDGLLQEGTTPSEDGTAIFTTSIVTMRNALH